MPYFCLVWSWQYQITLVELELNVAFVLVTDVISYCVRSARSGRNNDGQSQKPIVTHDPAT